jgi:hypothetical protein
VITAAALVPHPPLLLRELGGLVDPVAELRAAAESAVRAVVADVSRVVVVGGADDAGTWDADLAPDVRRFGTTGPRRSTGLPLSLGVGRRLLHDVGWSGETELVAVDWDADADDVDDLAGGLAAISDDTALLLLGDGGARRGETAPGYLDERAFPFDDAVARALADGDPRALRDLDTDLARELMVGGRTVLRVLGAVALAQRTAPRAELVHRDDPYGVTYFVARWLLPRLR